VNLNSMVDNWRKEEQKKWLDDVTRTVLDMNRNDVDFLLLGNKTPRSGTSNSTMARRYSDIERCCSLVLGETNLEEIIQWRAKKLDIYMQLKEDLMMDWAKPISADDCWHIQLMSGVTNVEWDTIRKHIHQVTNQAFLKTSRTTNKCASAEFATLEEELGISYIDGGLGIICNLKKTIEWILKYLGAIVKDAHKWKIALDGRYFAKTGELLIGLTPIIEGIEQSVSWVFPVTIAKVKEKYENLNSILGLLKNHWEEVKEQITLDSGLQVVMDWILVK